MSQLEAHWDWINHTLKPRYPELVDPYCAALIGYDQISETGKIEGRTLEYVVNAAKSQRAWLFELGMNLLGKLAMHHEEARQAIQLMFADKKADIRVNSLMCLHKSLPTTLTTTLLSKGLADRSVRVRRISIYQAWGLNLSELIPVIEKQVQLERNLGAKAIIELHLALLRDGYALLLDAHNSGNYWLWVATPNGGMRGRSVSQTEIDRRGIQAIVGAKKPSKAKE